MEEITLVNGRYVIPRCDDVEIAVVLKEFAEGVLEANNIVRDLEYFQRVESYTESGRQLWLKTVDTARRSDHIDKKLFERLYLIARGEGLLLHAKELAAHLQELQRDGMDKLTMETAQCVVKEVTGPMSKAVQALSQFLPAEPTDQGIAAETGENITSRATESEETTSTAGSVEVESQPELLDSQETQQHSQSDPIEISIDDEPASIFPTAPSSNGSTSCSSTGLPPVEPSPPSQQPRAKKRRVEQSEASPAGATAQGVPVITATTPVYTPASLGLGHLHPSELPEYLPLAHLWSQLPQYQLQQLPPHLLPHLMQTQPQLAPSPTFFGMQGAAAVSRAHSVGGIPHHAAMQQQVPIGARRTPTGTPVPPVLPPGARLLSSEEAAEYARRAAAALHSQSRPFPHPAPAGLVGHQWPQQQPLTPQQLQQMQHEIAMQQHQRQLAFMLQKQMAEQAKRQAEQ